VFDENVFPFDELHENVGAQLCAEILLVPPPLRNFHGHDIVDDLRAYSANPGSGVDGVLVEQNSAEAKTHQGENAGENSITDAMDLVGAIDPQAQSISDPMSAGGHASPLDRGPDPASSAHAQLATSGSVSGSNSPAASLGSAPDSPAATSLSDTWQSSALVRGLSATDGFGSAMADGSVAESAPQPINTQTTVVAPPVVHRPRTRLQDNIMRTKVYKDGTIRYDHSALSALREPETLHEVLSDVRVQTRQGTIWTQAGTEGLVQPAKCETRSAGVCDLQGGHFFVHLQQEGCDHVSPCVRR
jgi:hypothetical protein